MEQEAQVMRNLENPNIPKLLDFFTAETESTIEVYLVQEYIKGENLKEVIKKGKLFNESEVIELALKICKILIYIHSFSPPIIHQDIKPANILINNRNEIFLIDFGAAKQNILFQKDDAGLSTILGTQGFMPIEQFEGRTVPASDIYSLGLTLIYLLSGKEPLQMDKNGLKIDFKKYISASDEFQDVLEKMLHPDFKNRYQTASELEIDLFNAAEEKRLKSKKGKRIYEIVHSELNETEKLRWYDKDKHFYYHELFLIIINIATALLFYFIPENNPYFAINIFSMLFCEFFDIYSLIIFATIGLFATNKIFAITSQRIITINDSAFNLSLNKKRVVRSFNIKHLRDVKVYGENKKKNAEYIELIFENSPHDFVIRNIENSYFVYKILKDIIKERKSHD